MNDSTKFCLICGNVSRYMVEINVPICKKFNTAICSKECKIQLNAVTTVSKDINPKNSEINGKSGSNPGKKSDDIVYNELHLHDIESGDFGINYNMELEEENDETKTVFQMIIIQLILFLSTRYNDYTEHDEFIKNIENIKLLNKTAYKIVMSSTIPFKLFFNWYQYNLIIDGSVKRNSPTRITIYNSVNLTDFIRFTKLYRFFDRSIPSTPKGKFGYADNKTALVKLLHIIGLSIYNKNKDKFVNIREIAEKIIINVLEVELEQKDAKNFKSNRWVFGTMRLLFKRREEDLYSLKDIYSSNDDSKYIQAIEVVQDLAKHTMQSKKHLHKKYYEREWLVNPIPLSIMKWKTETLRFIDLTVITLDIGSIYGVDVTPEDYEGMKNNVLNTGSIIHSTDFSSNLDDKFGFHFDLNFDTAINSSFLSTLEFIFTFGSFYIIDAIINAEVSNDNIRGGSTKETKIEKTKLKIEKTHLKEMQNFFNSLQNVVNNNFLKTTNSNLIMEQLDQTQTNREVFEIEIPIDMLNELVSILKGDLTSISDIFKVFEDLIEYERNDDGELTGTLANTFLSVRNQPSSVNDNDNNLQQKILRNVELNITLFGIMYNIFSRGVQFLNIKNNINTEVLLDDFEKNQEQKIEPSTEQYSEMFENFLSKNKEALVIENMVIVPLNVIPLLSAIAYITI